MYIYVCAQGNVRSLDKLIVRAATIRGRLLFFSASAMCSYYNQGHLLFDVWLLNTVSVKRTFALLIHMGLDILCCMVLPINCLFVRQLFKGGSYFSASALCAATDQRQLIFDVWLLFE